MRTRSARALLESRTRACLWIPLGSNLRKTPQRSISSPIVPKKKRCNPPSACGSRIVRDFRNRLALASSAFDARVKIHPPAALGGPVPATRAYHKTHIRYRIFN